MSLPWQKQPLFKDYSNVTGQKEYTSIQFRRLIHFGCRGKLPQGRRWATPRAGRQSAAERWGKLIDVLIGTTCHTNTYLFVNQWIWLQGLLGNLTHPLLHQHTSQGAGGSQSICADGARAAINNVSLLFLPCSEQLSRDAELVRAFYNHGGANIVCFPIISTWKLQGNSWLCYLLQVWRSQHDWATAKTLLAKQRGYSACVANLCHKCSLAAVLQSCFLQRSELYCTCFDCPCAPQACVVRYRDPAFLTNTGTNGSQQCRWYTVFTLIGSAHETHLTRFTRHIMFAVKRPHLFTVSGLRTFPSRVCFADAEVCAGDRDLSVTSSVI